MSEWNENQFLNLLQEPVRNGIYKKKEYHGRGVNIVNMGELFAHPRLTDVEMKRVELSNNEKEKCLLNNGDLIFARRSLTAEGAGKCSLIKELKEETTFESSIIRARPDSLKASSEFLYYYFNSPYGKYLLGTILRQVAVAGITGSDLMKLKLIVPNVTTQKAIASVLSSLDDKIDLLHRQNKTLEAMAETLFRQWFVKSENSKVLFFEELLDTVSIKHDFPNDKVIFLNTSDVYDGRVLNHDYSEVVGLPGQAKKSIQKDDILFTEIRPANRRFAYVDFNAEDYVVSTKLMVLRSKKVVDTSILYLFLKRQETLDYLQMLAEARSGTFPQITFDHLKTVEIYIPEDKKILKNITSVLQNVVQKTFKNHFQVHTLEKLRDTLLPKLMSGEVKITV